MGYEQLSGWGRFPRIDCRTASPRDAAGVAELVRHGPSIARGMGRAYGDSALNPGSVVSTLSLNRMLCFESETGRLVVEAGVVLGDIIETFLPRGWFPVVTPGTKFVSLGGAIAADVHGKNHHNDGSFGNFVEWLDLIDSEGIERRCSRTENVELFACTIGGMGLTGIILRACLRLRRVESAWIRQETIAYPDLAAVLAGFESSAESTYSVAWIDCLATGAKLGRSLLMLGEHATATEVGDNPLDWPRRRKLRVPFDAPAWSLNRWTVKAFNGLYYAKGAWAPRETLVDWDSYFYPLDGILEWNRIYGRRGFAQFQCVLPAEASEAGLTELLTAIAAAGQGSFLAVLKRLGPQDSVFSFPMDGYTLALDFPISRKVLALLDRLDAITLDHSGRFYLAKDSRMRADALTRSDARVGPFREMRMRTGAHVKFTSLQSVRLAL